MQQTLFTHRKPSTHSRDARNEAHEAVDKSFVRDLILAFLKANYTPFGIDAFTFAKALSMPITSIRPRLTELAQDGKIVVSGRVFTTHSRTKVSAYKLNMGEQ